MWPPCIGKKSFSLEVLPTGQSPVASPSLPEVSGPFPRTFLPSAVSPMVASAAAFVAAGPRVLLERDQAVLNLGEGGTCSLSCYLHLPVTLPLLYILWDKCVCGPLIAI